MHLQAVVDDVEALVSGKLLSHRAVHRVVRISSFNEFSTMSNHESGCFQISCHLRKLELDVLVVCDRLPELLSAFDVLCSGLNASSCASKRTARNVKSATIETRQSDLKALALLAKKVLLGHLDVVKVDNTSWLHVPSKLVLVGSE